MALRDESAAIIPLGKDNKEVSTCGVSRLLVVIAMRLGAKLRNERYISCK